jgi:hypothetical protein
MENQKGNQKERKEENKTAREGYSENVEWRGI